MALVDIKINVEHRDGGIYVYRNGDVNDPVTDLTKSNFTIECSIDGVGKDSTFIDSTFDIVEVSKTLKPGAYDLVFTPDQYRIWSVKVSIFKAGEYDIAWDQDYRVMDQLVDDIDVENLGPGNRVVRLTFEDADDGTPIADCWVTVYNLALTTKLAYAFTDSNGRVTFWLDDGSYYVMARKLGQYTFNLPLQLTVVGATNVTYEGTKFSPGTPSAPNTCIVWGHVLTQDGAPLGGVEVVADVQGDRLFLRSNPQIIRQASTTTSRASDGYWSLVLTRSVQYARANVKYQFTIDKKSVGAVIIPDQDSVGLHELTDQIPCIGRST
jgi:hypothetical protein